MTTKIEIDLDHLAALTQRLEELEWELGTKDRLLQGVRHQRDTFEADIAKYSQTMTVAGERIEALCHQDENRLAIVRHLSLENVRLRNCLLRLREAAIFEGHLACEDEGCPVQMADELLKENYC